MKNMTSPLEQLVNDYGVQPKIKISHTGQEFKFVCSSIARGDDLKEVAVTMVRSGLAKAWDKSIDCSVGKVTYRVRYQGKLQIPVAKVLAALAGTFEGLGFYCTLT